MTDKTASTDKNGSTDGTGDAPPKGQAEAASLLRTLGPWIATAVVVGNVIGSGIFLKPGNIAAASGNFGVIISVWVLGGVLCLLGGLCFAELSAMRPHAGGMYVYLREAYGRQVAFLFGWTEVFFGKPASIGALSVAFVGSLNLALGNSLSSTLQLLLAVVLIVSMAGVNIIGVLWGGWLQMVVTIIKVTFVVLLAIVPFVLIPFEGHVYDVANYSTTVAPSQANFAAQLGTVLLAVMWAYNGWHGVTPLAEEVRDPQRNIPRALFWGIGILIVLYVSANFAYHGVLTMAELRDAGDDGAARMLEKLFGPVGVRVMSTVIMCSTFGAINTNLLQAPRITFAMGRDRVFFSSLGKVHREFRTPALAITVMAGMAIALVVSIAAAKRFVPGVEAAPDQVAPDRLWPAIVASLRNDSLFGLLTNLVVFSASIFYMLGVLAVIVLRFRQPDVKRPYRTWGYPVVPILFLTVYVWFMWQVYLGHPLESRAGLAFIALGVPVYWVYRFVDRR